MTFPLIAIVGRGCVLPGANDPAELWQTVVSGAVRLSPFSVGRSDAAPTWSGADPASTVYGHVTGFAERFDAGGLAVDAAEVARMDPTVRWVLHATRQALGGVERLGRHERTGVVLGNISAPTASMAAYAEDVWLRSQPPETVRAWPRHDHHPPIPAGRFCFGLPAHLTAQAFRLGAGAIVLEAACASVLYAVELACRKLHAHQADVMVAGGLNGSAPEIISHGMGRLGALSPSGRSRPFHRDADGLVPAEGAAMVALMRLEDALSSDVPVLGVIRGIGLTNDGGRGGMLVPDAVQQQRAMRLAYETAGIDPATVSLLECHATGTSVGDSVELTCAAQVFADRTDLPIGSVKGNLGHPLTAASGAALLKVLGAMEHGVLPPTVGADEANEAMRGTGLRPLSQPEDWHGPRRAAVSGFGFGGVNAHLIVDAWAGPDAVALPVAPPPAEPPARHAVAVVGLGARIGDGDGTADFVAALLAGRSRLRPPRRADLCVDGLRMPPNDMLQTSGEHILVLEAARDAAREVVLPDERTMVLVGIGSATVHAEFSVWHNRTTAGARKAAAAEGASADRVADPLDCPPWSLGALGNIAANRISAQFRLTDTSMAVCAEEASGIRAVELAADAIGRGASDAALVGAVDLGSTAVHRTAARDLGLPGAEGNAAVVIALKRLDHARRDGDPVLAVIDPRDGTRPPADLVVGDLGPARTGSDAVAALDPSLLFGRPHCAASLVGVACAVVALYHRTVPSAGAEATPRPGLTRAEVTVTPLGAPEARLSLTAEDTVSARSRLGIPQTRADGSGRPARRLSSIAFFDLRKVLRLQEPDGEEELVALTAEPDGAGAGRDGAVTVAIAESVGAAVPGHVGSVAAARTRPVGPDESTAPDRLDADVVAAQSVGHVAPMAWDRSDIGAVTRAASVDSAGAVGRVALGRPGAVVAPPVGEDVTAAALSGHHEAVGRAHREFLDARHANHELFMRMQEQATQALLQAAATFHGPFADAGGPFQSAPFTAEPHTSRAVVVPGALASGALPAAAGDVGFSGASGAFAPGGASAAAVSGARVDASAASASAARPASGAGVVGTAAVVAEVPASGTVPVAGPGGLGTAGVSGTPRPASPSVAARLARRGPDRREFTVSPEDDPWVLDHCPTWTLPVLPMMSSVDHLLRAACSYSGMKATGLRGLRLKRWIPVVGLTRLATAVEPVEGSATDVRVGLSMWRPARTAALSRFEPVADAIVTFDPPERPGPLASLADVEPADLPYLTNRLPHGPAFQYLTEVSYGSNGAFGILDAERGAVPGTFTHPGLLDAATHIIADRKFWLPYPQVGPNVVPYPHGIVRLDLFEPFPDTGRLRVDARPAGADGDLLFVDFQVRAGDRLCAAFRNVSMVSPPSALELQTGADRRAFLLERRAAPKLSLSQVTDGVSRLDMAVLEQADWPTGGLAYIYGLPAGAPARGHAEEITMREHVARKYGEHPSRVAVDLENRAAWLRDRPDRRHLLVVRADKEGVTVEDRL